MKTILKIILDILSEFAVTALPEIYCMFGWVTGFAAAVKILGISITWE